jgi:hypothetical protein
MSLKAGLDKRLKASCLVAKPVELSIKSTSFTQYCLRVDDKRIKVRF